MVLMIRNLRIYDMIVVGLVIDDVFYVLNS